MSRRDAFTRDAFTRDAFTRDAFTLVQLLVIIALILILLGLLIPALAQVRRAAKRFESLNNLRQIGLASHNFHDVHKKFPPAVDEAGPAHFHILPFIEQNELYNHGEGKSWKNDVYSQPVSVYIDPADPSAPPGNKYQNWLATTNYAINWMIGDRRITTITDGTSNTIMFTQRYQMCNGTPTAWGYPALTTWAPVTGYYSRAMFQTMPTQAECDPRLAQSLGGNGIQTLFCDGSVRHLRENMSPQNWWALMTPDGGEIVNIDDD